MDGGQVVPCVIKHSKIGVAGLAITIAGEAQPMNWELLGTIYKYKRDPSIEDVLYMIGG
jgi:hypothetical protein